MAKTLLTLKEAIEAAGSAAIILHVAPDGDTCGAGLALRRALVSLGKEALVVCDDPIPTIYAWLPGAAEVVRPETLLGRAFDVAVAVDVADRGRLGRSAAVFDRAARTAQIDHHPSNPGYAGINYIRPLLSAAGVLAGEVIDCLGAPFDRETALCLYAAVATDTGCFKQQNTDAQALRLAARCVEAGLDVAGAARRFFDLRPLCQVKLIGRALESLATFAGGRLAMMRLTAEDFSETAALPEHTEGVVTFAVNTEGVQIACLMSAGGEKIKCSLRATAPYDVGRVAARFGGGGHAQAAGCHLDPPWEDAYQRMREALEGALVRGT